MTRRGSGFDQSGAYGDQRQFGGVVDVELLLDMVEMCTDGAGAEFERGGDIRDRAFITDWYVKRNQRVIDTLPAERLLVFHPSQGWEPLCAFLGVDVPPVRFPKVNSRDELSTAADHEGGMPTDPAKVERWARDYMAQLAEKAFA